MAGFEAVADRIEAVGIVGMVWLDGSFTTQKEEPGDVDFVLITPGWYRYSGTQDQQECIEWLINQENDPKKAFRCDIDVILEEPPDSTFHDLFEDTKRHYLELYGYSVSTREPKGIVELRIPEPTAVPEDKGEEEVEV